MIRKTLTLVFAGLVLGACRPANTVTDEQRTAATAEVRQTLEALFAAMNAHDSDSVLSFYRNDPDLAYVGLIQPIVGKAAFARAAGPYYDRQPDVTFDVTVLHIQILSPTVAAAVTTGNSTENANLVWTHVFVKDADGRWLVAQEHEAWPDCVEAPTVSEHPGM